MEGERIWAKRDFATFTTRNSNKEEHRLSDQSRKCFTGLRINIHANVHLYFHIMLPETQNDILSVSESQLSQQCDSWHTVADFWIQDAHAMEQIKKKKL